MAAREGMTELIAEVRALASAGTADYSVAGATYWTDDQIQTLLDRRSREVKYQEIRPLWEYSGGAVIYKDYPLPAPWFERDLAVLDLQGSALGTALYAVDYDAGLVRFEADTAGSAVYISGRSFDLYRAAADLWRRKAAQVAAASYSWSTDNMSINKGQLRSEYLRSASECERLAGPTVVEIRRGDE